MRPHPLSPATLLTFPLFHVGGLQSFLLPYTAFGGKIVLMYKWDVDQAVELIEREQVTAVAGVPTTVFQLLETAAEQGRSLSSLGAISSGATLVPPELVRRIDEQFASRAAPTNGYGLTETSGAAIANGGADYVARPDSVGRPLSPVMDVRIDDGAGGDAAGRRRRRDLVEGPHRGARLLRQPRGDRATRSSTAGSARAISVDSTTRASSTSSTG